jgi:hypothetical protein
MGQNCFVPGFVPGTKITPLSRGQKSHFFFGGLPPAVGETMRSPDSGCRSSPPPPIILPPPRRVQVTKTTTTTKRTSRRREQERTPMGEGDDDPMTAWHWAGRESASSDADAHGGRTTPSNDVTNERGGAAGNASGRVHRQQSAKKRQRLRCPQTTISQKAAAIAVETAVVVAAAAAADDDMGDDDVATTTWVSMADNGGVDGSVKQRG